MMVLVNLPMSQASRLMKRKTPPAKQNDQGNLKQSIGVKQPELGCNLGPADLQVKLDLGWIFLRGCKI